MARELRSNPHSIQWEASEIIMVDKQSDTAHAVFQRQSTGLVKNVSFLDSIAVNISYMSIGAALALIGFTMSALPTVSGLNLVYASVIAAGLTIPQMIVYTIMTRRMPRTGGDYVWLSRSLGGFVGSTITFMGITLETMPYLALIALSAVFAVGSVGLSLGYSDALPLALPSNLSGSDPLAQFALAAIIFSALIGINILRPRLGFKIVSVFWIMGVLAIIVATLSLLLAGRIGVANYVNSLNISGVTFTSIANSYNGSAFNLGSTALMLPFFALFSYPWFQAAPSVGSELKSGNTVRWNVPVSLLIAFVLLTIPLATMYYVGGLGFTNAALSNPTLVNDYSFNFWTLAMGVSNNFLLKAFIGLGWIVSVLGILAFGIISVSRYIFAQAFDRFLPERLGYVSPKYRSPLVAHLVDLLITLTLIGLAAFLYGTISSLYGVFVSSMIYLAFVGVAAMVYGFKKEKGRAKMVLVITGIFQTVVFIYLTYEFLSYPKVWGGNILAYGYVVVSFVIGTAIYAISKRRHADQGLDISFAFKEIPPE